jgi:hypothetical protein
MLGPRFLGTHKVFAPPPELRSGGTEHREDVTRNIIGLHALYDYQVRGNGTATWFRQLI